MASGIRVWGSNAQYVMGAVVGYNPKAYATWTRKLLSFASYFTTDTESWRHTLGGRHRSNTCNVYWGDRAGYTESWVELVLSLRVEESRSYSFSKGKSGVVGVMVCNLDGILVCSCKEVG